ncbi:Hint domain-containing protein [Lacimonas salitolerans]|uniref:Hint domain-containing protein n=1 Tax=Lacimonas salitolerans TaxID=1323750 RepID=A0ABW4EHB0_9RHOB
MAEVEIFVTGDEIATFNSVATSGNNNGMKVTLFGVQPLGSATDVFRVVIRQVNTGDPFFSNGQFVDIYAWPEIGGPQPPIYSNLNPQHDQFQGRASSAEHQIMTNPAKIVFDVNGLTAGTVQYGPGFDPPRAQKLAFSTFSDDPPDFPCFCAGTLIETDTGPLPVEVIRPGDLVQTLDHGLQQVRWAGQRRVPGRGALAPIRFQAGALGNYRDLLVSPQHRMLLRDWRAEMHFGQNEVLVAARHLVNGTTIRSMPVPRVTYVHLAFDDHQVIWAEGVPSESLHTGAMALAALDTETRDELLTLFPELADQQGQPAETARPCLKAWEARLVA